MSNTLVPRHPYTMLDPFRQEIESLFDRFFGGPSGNGQAIQAWSPRVDIEETEKEIIVRADLPGVDPKAVEVIVENDVLTVRGEKKQEAEESKQGYHRLERFTGSFYRAISLPSGADASKVCATGADGVVTVTIPKKAEARSRRVPVTTKT